MENVGVCVFWYAGFRWLASCFCKKYYFGGILIMKKNIVLVLVIVITLSITVLLSSCNTNRGENGVTSGKDASIEYTLLADGTYSAAFGKAADVEAVEILATYNGKAVTEIHYNGDPENDMTSLKKLSVPDSVIEVSDEIFRSCPNIEFAEYDNAYYIGNADNPFVVLVETKNAEITSCEIHENTKIIMGDAFCYHQKITDIKIPDGVRKIGLNAFFGCSALESVTLGKSVEILHYGAFQECKNLKR